ncbi:12914_t:CDS:2 [Funneliformis geosporum]|nr:12914_t:CDS:2 [Funneliformis geosporum]
MANASNPMDDNESFVISPDMKHVVILNADSSLDIWDVGTVSKTLKLNKDIKINPLHMVHKHKPKMLLQLSNDKLLIYSCEDHNQLNQQNVILQLNIEKMKIENFYVIPNITKKLHLENTTRSNLFDVASIDCRGAVNMGGSLLAVFLKFENVCHTTVFSMKNGILISQRQCHFDGNMYSLQFMNIKSTEILLLHRRIDKSIEYMIMEPYNLKCKHGGKYYNQEFHAGFTDNYKIFETSTFSQCLIMFYTGSNFKLIDFDIPVEKLYDQLKDDPYLFLYSSFNYFKDVIKSLGKNNGSFLCKGDKLRWEYKDKLKFKMQGQQIIEFDYKFEEIKLLQILSNDDVVLINQKDIYVFGFNVETNKIVLRYCYQNIDEFVKKKSLPFPKFNELYNKYGELSHQVDQINELLCSKKYLVEMGEEIIDQVIEWKEKNLTDCNQHKMEELLDNFFDAVYKEYLEEDTMTKCRIYGLIANYLPKLSLHFPIQYSKFISVTTFITCPYFSEDSSLNKPLVGYSYCAYTIQVFNKYDDCILRISEIFQKFGNYIYNNFRLLTKKRQTKKNVIRFVVPYLGFTIYSSDYYYLMELLRPTANPFITIDDQAFYDNWNTEAIINFKWDTYGRIYYHFSWGFFTLLLLSFGIGSTLSTSVMSNDTRNAFLIISIVLGSFHIIHEIRQFIWNTEKYIINLWNWIVYTAVVWISDVKPSLSLISLSNLFLYFKFITFLRALDYFGTNLTIIVGVAKRIHSFLFILLIIIIGFAHAFYIILSPAINYNLDEPEQNSDPNNPWNLVAKYQTVSPDDKIISPNTAFIQHPESNLNLFSTYQTSLLAMYLFLTGDSSAISSWAYQENPFMTTLLVMFSFLIVVYLMNLFIGLLNLEIENNRTHHLYMLNKANILAEIELFYMLPNQRRWRHWFPDVIVYEMPINEVQRRIKDIDNNPEPYNSPNIEQLRILAKLNDPKKDPMLKIDYECLVMLKDEIRILIDENFSKMVEIINQKTHDTVIDIVQK